MDNMLLEKYASMMQKQASIKLQQEYGMEKQAFGLLGAGIKRVGDWASQAGESVDKAITNGAKSVGSAIGRGANAVWQGAKSVGSAIGRGANAAWQGAKDFASNPEVQKAFMSPFTSPFSAAGLARGIYGYMKQPSGQSGVDPRYMIGIGLKIPGLEGINPKDWLFSSRNTWKSDPRLAMTGGFGLPSNMPNTGNRMAGLAGPLSRVAAGWGLGLQAGRNAGSMPTQQAPKAPSAPQAQPAQQSQPFAQQAPQTPNYSDQIDQWGGTLGTMPGQFAGQFNQYGM